jgi:hypothetical protein
LNERSDAMRLAGWGTLTNWTGTAFEQAEVQLVAGKLNILEEYEGGSAAEPVYAERGENEVDARARIINEEAVAEVALLRECFAADVPQQIRRRELVRPLAMMALQRSVGFDALEEITVTASRIEREEFGDYQLYRLPWRTDLAARQTKQALFLDEPAVEVERFYGVRLESLTESPAAEVVIPNLIVRFENTAAEGLGEPLPSGVVRVFEEYGGREVFAGEAQIGDRPVGLPIELTIGRAQNVMLEVTMSSNYADRRGSRSVAVATEHRVVNNKAVPIELEIRHAVESYYSDVRVDDSTRPMRRKYGDLAWRFVVQPGEELLRYRLSALSALSALAP